MRTSPDARPAHVDTAPAPARRAPGGGADAGGTARAGTPRTDPGRPALVADDVLAATADLPADARRVLARTGGAALALAVRSDGATVAIELLEVRHHGRTAEGPGEARTWWSARPLAARHAPADELRRSRAQLEELHRLRRDLLAAARGPAARVPTDAGPPAALRSSTPPLRGPGLSASGPGAPAERGDLATVRARLRGAAPVRLRIAELEARRPGPDPADPAAAREGWPAAGASAPASGRPGRRADRAARRWRTATAGPPGDPWAGARLMIACGVGAGGTGGRRVVALALVLAVPVGGRSRSARAWTLERCDVAAGDTAGARRALRRLEQRRDVLEARLRCAEADRRWLIDALGELGAPR